MILFRALIFVVSMFFILTPQRVDARPLLTEEVATMSRATFEAAISVSRRVDEFNSPVTKYETVLIPVRARIGLSNNLDFGFTLTHVTQRLEKGTIQLEGSRPALLSPELKYSFSESLGIIGIWHTKRGETSNQDLPIARGDDIEALALFKLPFGWKTHVNIGYLVRGRYFTKFGVDGGLVSRVEPGNIFESRASIEIPIGLSFSLLTEAAYYNVEKQKIASQTITDSEGQAADALVGLVWEKGGWNIGAGAAFGLLDESHTSFDLHRGAGDWLGKLTIAYKLKAKKPGS